MEMLPEEIEFPLKYSKRSLFLENWVQ